MSYDDNIYSPLWVIQIIITFSMEGFMRILLISLIVFLGTGCAVKTADTYEGMSASPSALTPQKDILTLYQLTKAGFIERWEDTHEIGSLTRLPGSGITSSNKLQVRYKRSHYIDDRKLTDIFSESCKGKTVISNSHNGKFPTAATNEFNLDFNELRNTYMTTTAPVRYQTLVKIMICLGEDNKYSGMVFKQDTFKGRKVQGGYIDNFSHKIYYLDDSTFRNSGLYIGTLEERRIAKENEAKRKADELAFERAKRNEFYYSQIEQHQSINSNNHKRWNERAHKVNEKGIKICSYDNKYGFVEDLSDNNLKVLWVSEIINVEDGFFFGEMRFNSMSQSKLGVYTYKYLELNRQEWVARNDVGVCDIKI